MKLTTLFVCALAAACLFADAVGSGNEEEKAVKAIRDAGGSVGWDPKGPLVGKYHRLLCPWNADADAVMKQVKYLKDLDLVWFWSDVPASRPHTPGDKYIEVLADIPGLKDLRLEVTSDEAMKHLGTIKNLEELQLYATNVTRAGARHLAGLTKLRDLRVSGIADGDLEYIGHLAELKRLTIIDRKTTDAGLKHLAGLKKLESLYLWTTAVANTGLKELVGLPDLRDLRFAYSQVNDEGCKLIAGIQQLTQLDLSDTKVTDKGIKYLADLNKLEKLWLTQTALRDEGLLALARGCKSLKLLAIGATKTSEKAQEEFCKLRPEVKLIAY